MSINKFQEKIFRTGCGTAVLYVAAAVFAGGMFYMGCGNLGGGRGDQPVDATKTLAIQVGEVPIYAEEITYAFEQLKQRRLQEFAQTMTPDQFPPDQEANYLGEALNELITAAVTYDLAKKDGVKFTDVAMTKAADQIADEQLMSLRMQYMQSQKIKPDATEKEFDAAMKADKGITSEDYHKQLATNLAKDLKSSDTRAALEQQYAGPLLLDTVKANLKPTDAEVKADFDSSEFKRVVFSLSPGTDANAQIAKAQADLKSGMTFEQVVNRYSSETAPKGKKISDNVISLVASQLDTPDYLPLKSLKTGEVSGPIETPQGKALYKMIGTKNTAPPDFPSNVAKYRDQYVSRKANDEIDMEQKDFLKNGKIVWDGPGYKALYDWVKTTSDAALSPADKAAKFQSVLDEAQKAVDNGKEFDERAAHLAWFAAENSIWTTPGADKVKLRPDRIAALKEITDLPYTTLRFELVDLLIDDKNGTDADQMLERIATDNSAYDATGEKTFQDVNGRILKLQAAKLITDAQVAEIRKIQDGWQKDKADDDKNRIIKAKADADAMAEAKAQDAKDAKLKADTLAKQKADADKATKAQGPASTPPGSAPTTTTTPKQAPIVPPVKK